MQIYKYINEYMQYIQYIRMCKCTNTQIYTMRQSHITTVVLLLNTVAVGMQFTVLNLPQFWLTCTHFKVPDELRPYGSLGPLSRFPQCVPIENDESLGAMVMWFYAGALLGCLVADFSNLYHLVKWKSLLLSGHAAVCVGTAGMVASASVGQLCWARFLAGVGSGVQFSVIAEYLELLVDLNVVASTALLPNVFNYTLVPLGVLLCQLVSLPFDDSFRWRWIFVVVLAVNLAACGLVLRHLVESPKWYLVRGSHDGDEARATLVQYLARDDESRASEIIDAWREEANSNSNSNSGSGSGSGSPSPQHAFGMLKHYFASFERYAGDHHGRIQLSMQLFNVNFINQYGIKLFNETMSDGQAVRLAVMLSAVGVASSMAYVVVLGRIINLRRKFLLNVSLILTTVSLLLLFVSLQPQQQQQQGSSHTFFVVSTVLFVLSTSLIANNVPLGSAVDTRSVVLERSSRVCFWVGQIIVAYAFPLVFDLVGHFVFLVMLAVPVATLAFFYHDYMR